MERIDGREGCEKQLQWPRQARPQALLALEARVPVVAREHLVTAVPGEGDGERLPRGLAEEVRGQRRCVREGLIEVPEEPPGNVGGCRSHLVDAVVGAE